MVELNKAKLESALAHWREAGVAMRSGELSFAEGVGVHVGADPDALHTESGDFDSEPWLR